MKRILAALLWRVFHPLTHPPAPLAHVRTFSQHFSYLLILSTASKPLFHRIIKSHRKMLHFPEQSVSIIIADVPGCSHGSRSIYEALWRLAQQGILAARRFQAHPWTTVPFSGPAEEGAACRQEPQHLTPSGQTHSPFVCPAAGHSLLAGYYQAFQNIPQRFNLNFISIKFQFDLKIVILRLPEQILWAITSFM